MAWTTKPEFNPPNNEKQPWPKFPPSPENSGVVINQIWQAIQALPLTEEDLATGKRVVLTEYKDDVIKQTDITKKVHSNLKPTHDPYTNPDSHIYYECSCGAILDPGTRSFAQLNNVASAKDWKVRWRKDGQGYEAFCVECGKDKE